MFIYVLLRATLYPSPRSSMCILYICYHYKNNKIQKQKQKKKKNPGLPWVKISKLCHNPIVHFPREREGYLMAKNPSISGSTA